MAPRLAAAALAVVLLAACSGDDGGESVDTASDPSPAELVTAPEETTEATDVGDDGATATTLDDPPVTSTPTEATSEPMTTAQGEGDPVDTSTPGDTTPGDTPDLCVEMEELANWNAVNEIDLSGDWPEAQAQLAEAGEESLVLYDEALAVLPEEPRAWLQTMRDWNDDFFAAVAEADSIDVSGEFISDVPPGLESATTNFDGYLRDTCGFGLTQG